MNEVDMLRAQLAAMTEERDRLAVKLWGVVTRKEDVSFRDFAVEVRDLVRSADDVLKECVHQVMQSGSAKQTNQLPFDLVQDVANRGLNELRVEWHMNTYLAENVTRLEVELELPRQSFTVAFDPRRLEFERVKKARSPEYREPPNRYAPITPPPVIAPPGPQGFKP